MRYLFSTGLFGAITAGFTLLRGSRETPNTWRSALAWVSWLITLTLAIGAVVDMRRDERGVIVAPDSPIADVQRKRAAKAAKADEKEKKASKKR